MFIPHLVICWIPYLQCTVLKLQNIQIRYETSIKWMYKDKFIQGHPGYYTMILVHSHFVNSSTVTVVLRRHTWYSLGFWWRNVIGEVSHIDYKSVCWLLMHFKLGQKNIYVCLRSYVKKNLGSVGRHFFFFTIGKTGNSCSRFRNPIFHFRNFW